MAKIDEKTLAILSRVTVVGNVIFLNCGQLDRKDYLAVNKILGSMKGKWDRTVQCHVFKEDPTDKLEHVLLTGEITTQQDLGSMLQWDAPPAIMLMMIGHHPALRREKSSTPYGPNIARVKISKNMEEP